MSKQTWADQPGRREDALNWTGPHAKLVAFDLFSVLSGARSLVYTFAVSDFKNRTLGNARASLVAAFTRSQK